VERKGLGEIKDMITAKERLVKFLRQYPFNFIRTSEIILWGTREFSNRADRNARELSSDGFLERLSKEEAVLNGFNTREGIYRIMYQN